MWLSHCVYRGEGGIIIELLEYAFKGVNIVPTVLLLLVVSYWLIAIIGALDFDLFDVEIDIDALDGTDALSPLQSIAIFLRIGKVPFGLVISIWVLDFWVMAMLMRFLPINHGGALNGLLLVVAFIISFILTKYQIIPLGKIFNTEILHNDGIDLAIENRCTLLSDLEPGRLGQAAVYRVGADIVINVMTDFSTDHFKKGERALIMRKDEKKNIYYVTKTILDGDFLRQHNQGGDK